MTVRFAVPWTSGDDGADRVSVCCGRGLHRGALLSDGHIDGLNLICGVHGWDDRYETGSASVLGMNWCPGSETSPSLRGCGTWAWAADPAGSCETL